MLAGSTRYLKHLHGDAVDVRLIRVHFERDLAVPGGGRESIEVSI